MLLTKIAAVILFILLIQPIEGNKRIFTVMCYDQLTSHIKESLGSGSGFSLLLSNSYCINGNCSYSFNHLAGDLSNDSVINITCDIELPSVITIVNLTNITIAGHNNPTVGCNDSGGLQFLSCHHVKIEGIIWDRCGSDNRSDYAVIELDRSFTIIIQHCTFQQSIGQVIMLIEISGDVIIDHCMFLNNTKYSGYGSVIYYLSERRDSSIMKLLLTNSNFNGNEGAKSIIYLNSSSDAKEQQFLSLENSTFYDNKRVLFHLVNQNLQINNTCFKENGKISILFHVERSNIIFNGNSEIHIFNLTDDTAFSFLLHFSNITFKGRSMIWFNSSGSTIALYSYSNLTFEDSCNIISNDVYSIRSIYAQDHSSVVFRGNSTALFSNTDRAVDGGVIYSRDHSSIAFQGNSNVSFFNNGATYGGAIQSRIYSKVIFQESSKVSFKSNRGSQGGAIHIKYHSGITFQGNSTVSFTNNVAFHGAALYLESFSNITHEGNSTVSFQYNIGNNQGGAIFSQFYGFVAFMGQSKTIFIHNRASNQGGALYLYGPHYHVTFGENSDVSFQYNSAGHDGGAIFFSIRSSVTFTEFSRVIFSDNTAMNAGALHGNINSAVTFDGNTEVLFMRNNASNNGGAMYLYNIAFKGNSYVNFVKNTALGEGGACAYFSSVSFMDNANVNFTSNTAVYGGAVALFDKFYATFQKAKVIFTNNMANYGGAILCDFSSGGRLSFDMQRDGGLNFYNNTALIWGNSISIDDIPNACNKSCLNERLQGIAYMEDVQQHITTAPYKIALQTESHQHTIICTEFDDAYNDCTNYHVSDVMLGQKVSLKGYVYDFVDNLIPRETQIDIKSQIIDTNHTVQIPQNPYQDFDISIEGNEIISKYNYSMIITTFYYDYKYQRKDAAVQLSIQLSPCYLGFQHNSVTRRCECYDRDDIVLCTGSSSTIKRGYWLGAVEEKLTTTICPINYCNFTCCETSNGYHSLSPGRENQCTSHRSGIACGSCEEGYTLSYAAECVSVNKCSVGWTVLAVTLTMLYWIVIVIGVFAMMYYKLPIGYLYAITYYYSMVDVLLNQYLYIYPSLHTTINIISSVFKLDPQFLGQLCLVKGLSGVDIQFIQYIHPLAISSILVMITLLARYSRNLSLLIARGIINVICLLLLLSYTSMVSTSLLMLRSLKFYDVDKIYTYLSPDIEYFNGRHLLYFTVAVICVVTIITGLPSIILFQPLLNQKMNLTRIKPLLDQFQGCFKDQYRWFAAYYMICRLVQIAIVVYSSDFMITQYTLIATSVAISLVHVIVRPYNNRILNTFDAFVLHLMIIITVVPVLDTFSSSEIVIITFILIFLPILIFLLMGLIIHNATVNKLILSHCKIRSHKVTQGDNNERPIKNVGLIIDDATRRNAMICNMYR